MAQLQGEHMNQSMCSVLMDNDRLLQMSDINNVREDVTGERQKNTFVAKSEC